MSEGVSATFHDMSQSTQQDWDAIMSQNIPFARNGGRRVLGAADYWRPKSDIGAPNVSVALLRQRIAYRQRWR